MDLRIDKNLSSFLKFLAAITVALHHYSQYVCANHLSENILYKVLSSQGGYLAVGIFFFLSGYGLMESEKKHHLSPIGFIKKTIPSRLPTSVTCDGSLASYKVISIW